MCNLFLCGAFGSAINLGGKNMLIKRDHIFSVERIEKKNIFSETQSGRIYLHSKLIYKNPIQLYGEIGEKEYIYVSNIYVSKSGSYGFRDSKWDVDFVTAPIAGKFIISNRRACPIEGYYEILAEKKNNSRRYITNSQLEEIRKYGNYDLEIEQDMYIFVKLFKEISIKNEIRFYNFKVLYQLPITLPVADTKFFLKIPITNIRKVATTGCGINVYKIIETGKNAELLEEIIKEKTIKEVVLKDDNKHRKAIYDLAAATIKKDNKKEDIYINVGSEVVESEVESNFYLGSSIDLSEGTIMIEVKQEDILKVLSC